MKTLLIATDFSANARQAATYGYHLARQIHANVLLCHAVIDPAEIPQGGSVDLPDSEREGLIQDSKEALLQLQYELEHHARGAGFKPKIALVNSAGSLTGVVQEQLLKHPFQMVVMGTHAEDALGTFLLGDHCQKMRECLDQPILLVPPATKTGLVKRIAFASDFSDPARDLEVISNLIVVAKNTTAVLVLTHVYNDKNHSADFLQWTKHLLLEYIERADYAKIDYMVIQDREVEDGLDVLIRKKHIDIIAMVHHEHSFLYELLHQSHSQEMAQQTHIPLLIFKSKAS